jgi:hypothetical protein
VSWEIAQQMRAFKLASTGGANSGAISDTYGAGTVDKFQWIFNPALGGFNATSATATWPAWAGNNNDHYCIPFYAYGLTYGINTAALTAHLTGMDKPWSAPGTKLLTSAQVTAVMQMVSDLSAQTDAAALPKFTALKTGVAQMKVLLGAGSAAQVSASFATFYAQAAITSLRDTAIANFAEAVWNEAVQATVYSGTVIVGPSEQA